MKALGIDPGTSSFDLCCFEDYTRKVVYEGSVPTPTVAKSPEALLKEVEAVDADVIVGPSAMGLPVTHISQVTDRELAYATLGKNTEVDIAIRRFIQMLQAQGLNVYFVPSVIQLPTVPLARKLNRIDLGTADKTCIAALALWDHANHYHVGFGDSSLIVVELGFGFNAAMAVEKGKIVDGVGGTGFPGPGYLTIGAMDLELIHMLGSFSEEQLGVGGIAYAAGEIVTPEEYAQRLGEEKLSSSWKSLVQGVAKAVAMELTAFQGRSREIVLSGRLSRVPSLFQDLTVALGRFELPVRRVEGFAAKSKEAAQGAALIANGLGGGIYKRLVDILELREASGTVLDYIRWPAFDPVKVMEQKTRLMKT